MILEALAERLQTDGVGTVGTSIFIGLMPSGPDACVALFEYAGEAPMEVFGSGGASVDLVSVQVMARAGRNDYPTAYSLMESVRDSLTAVTDETIETVRFLRVRELSGINAIGVEENDRPRFTLSLQAVVER